MISVATITVIGKLSLHVDLTDFEFLLRIELTPEITELKTKDWVLTGEGLRMSKSGGGQLSASDLARLEARKRIIPTPEHTKFHNFYNAITAKISCERGKVVNMKVFVNGSVQITGCKHKKQARRSIDLFEEMIRRSGVPHTAPGPARFPIEIKMLNVVVQLGYKINKLRMHECLMENGYMSTYEPHKQISVNMKFLKENVTALVYSSGKVLLTSNCALQTLLGVVDVFLDFVDRHFSQIVILPEAMCSIYRGVCDDHAVELERNAKSVFGEFAYSVYSDIISSDGFI